MKLTIPTGELTLPRDFSFELEIKNPFFSEDGASTIPTEIPATAENLARLGFPTRLGSSLSSLKTFNSNLSHSIYSINGELVIGSADNENISASLIIKESILYSKLQDRKLKDIFADSKIYLTNAEEWMWDIYIDNSPKDAEGITVFPVRVTQNAFGFQTLNEPNKINTGFIYEKRTLSDSDGNKLELPYRYGLTPFLLLWKMIDLTFELCGYEVKENTFRNIPYNDITILNNTADACVKNIVYIADLVPSITVGELIIWLKDKFGAIISFDGKFVSIRLLQHCLNMRPDMDLTPLARTGESMVFTPKSRIIIDCDKSLEGAKPPADISISEYSSDKKMKAVNTESDIKAAMDELLYNTNEKVIVLRSGIIAQPLIVFGILYKNPIGSNSFKYDRGGTENSDERITNDRYVPVIIDQTNSLITPFIGNPIHHHTSISSEGNTEEEQPIQICLREWTNYHWFGTTQPYDFNGNELTYAFPLTPDGLYHNFWKSYNRILLNGAIEITVKVDFPIEKILSLDTMVPKLYNGQLVMIKSLTIAISDEGVTCDKCEMVVIPPSNIYIEDKDIYSRSSLIWKYVGYDDSIYDRNGDFTATDGFEDYTEEPEYSPSYFGEVALRRLRTGIYEKMDEPTQNASWYEYFIAVLKK